MAVIDYNILKKAIENLRSGLPGEVNQSIDNASNSIKSTGMDILRAPYDVYGNDPTGMKKASFVASGLPMGGPKPITPNSSAVMANSRPIPVPNEEQLPNNDVMEARNLVTGPRGGGAPWLDQSEKNAVDDSVSNPDNVRITAMKLHTEKGMPFNEATRKAEKLHELARSKNFSSLSDVYQKIDLGEFPNANDARRLNDLYEEILKGASVEKSPSGGYMVYGRPNIKDVVNQVIDKNTVPVGQGYMEQIRPTDYMNNPITPNNIGREVKTGITDVDPTAYSKSIFNKTYGDNPDLLKQAIMRLRNR